MASFSFLQKVEKHHTRSTPLDVKKLKKKHIEAIHPEVDEDEPHVATVVSHKLSLPKIDVFLVMTIVSGLFFLSAVAFWVYVQFFI